MKKWLLFFIIGFAHTQIWAQAPLGFNYQGIARQADGTPISGQTVGIRISIIEGPQGNSQFVEEHFLPTNDFGLFTAVVGQGNGNSTLNSVDWSLGNLWLQIELDPDNSGGYILMGSQQLMSVPYALFAQQSGEGLSPGYGISVNEGTISNVLPDRPISITGSGNVEVTGEYPNFNVKSNGSADADADPTNELQDLQLTGDILTITNNGVASEIDLTPYLDNTDTQLTEIEVDGFVANNGYLIAEVDDDVTNEIQTLTEVLAQGTNAGGVQITNLANPVASQDATTKNYVDTQDGTIQSLVASNTSDISSNVTDIASNAAATTANGSTIASNTSNITNNTSLIGINSSSITTNETDIASSAAAISANGSAITSNTSNITANTTSIGTNASSIITEVSARVTADTGLQSELDASQAGAGLAANGGYVQDVTTNYISVATSLQNADKILDAEIDASAIDISTNTGDISTNSTGISTNTADISSSAATITANGTAITSNASDITTNTTSIGTNASSITTEVSARATADTGLQSELDASQTGAGLAANGSYIADGSTTYITGATSLNDADKKLDTQIMSNSSSLTTLTSRIDNTYAFHADFVINETGAVSKTTVALSETLDNFNQIAADQIIIGASGLYLIVVDGERANSDIFFNLLYLRVQGADSNVPLFANSLNFGRTRIVSLSIGNVISLVASAGGTMAWPVSGSISGYKISD